MAQCAASDWPGRLSLLWWAELRATQRTPKGTGGTRPLAAECCSTWGRPGLALARQEGPEASPEAEVVKLLPFLAPGARADLQAAAVRHVLALTGSGPGRALLAGQEALLQALVELAPASAPARDAARALVNLAADPGLHETLLAADPRLPARLLGRALDPQWPWAEEAAAALANLSREQGPCAELMAALAAAEPADSGLERLVRALCTPGYNARAPLHYLAPLLSNLSQRPAARAFLLDSDRCVVQRLLPLTQYPDSSVRRGGVVGTLRNCCFEHRHHEWLLGPEVDILPFLLLPLAGPEDFSEEEMEREWLVWSLRLGQTGGRPVEGERGVQATGSF
ncbi:hypothetical protein H8959_004419 [Pygathrix nigripes]